MTQTEQKPSAGEMRVAQEITRRFFAFDPAGLIGTGSPVSDIAAIIHRAMAQERAGRPQIVCMCGSTRFKQTWISENARLTGEGFIVLSVGLWGHHERIEPSPEQKAKLDELHLRKIDRSDWVWVLDVGGYCGESTTREIAYAKDHGKPVRYLSAERRGYAEPLDPLEAQVAELRGVLAWCKDVIDHEVKPPQSCGACGTPNATCDGNCADAASFACAMRNVYTVLAKTAPKEGK